MILIPVPGVPLNAPVAGLNDALALADCQGQIQGYAPDEAILKIPLRCEFYCDSQKRTTN